MKFLLQDGDEPVVVTIEEVVDTAEVAVDEEVDIATDAAAEIDA